MAIIRVSYYFYTDKNKLNIVKIHGIGFNDNVVVDKTYSFSSLNAENILQKIQEVGTEVTKWCRPGNMVIEKKHTDDVLDEKSLSTIYGPWGFGPITQMEEKWKK